MARKRTHDDAARTKMVSVRLRDDTYDRITDAAAQAGLSRAGYVEHLIEDRPVMVEAVTGTALPTVLLNELKRIGNNLNQIAHNTHCEITPDDRALAKGMAELVRALAAYDLTRSRLANVMGSSDGPDFDGDKAWAKITAALSRKEPAAASSVLPPVEAPTEADTGGMRPAEQGNTAIVPVADTDGSDLADPAQPEVTMLESALSGVALVPMAEADALAPLLPHNLVSYYPRAALWMPPCGMRFNIAPTTDGGFNFTDPRILPVRLTSYAWYLFKYKVLRIKPYHVRIHSCTGKGQIVTWTVLGSNPNFNAIWRNQTISRAWYPVHGYIHLEPTQ